MKILKIISIFILSYISISPAFADVVERWQEAPAIFELKKTTIEEAAVPHTIVARLLNISGKSVDDLMDSDGKTIQYFVIKYDVPVHVTGSKKATKKTTIVQYGLCRSLDVELRASLSKHLTPYKTIVRYDVDNPKSFKFIVDNTAYTTPLLVTDN